MSGRKIKWLVRDTVLTAGYVSGLSSLYNLTGGRRSGVITYHNVLPPSQLGTGQRYQVDITRDIFESHVRYLSGRWPIRPAESLADDAPGFVLTFDDGMLNNATVVVPILEAHGLTGVFSICPSLVEGEIPYVWSDHLYLLIRRSVGHSLRMPDDDFETPVVVDDSSVEPLYRRIRRFVIDQRVQDVYGLITEFCRRNELSTDRTDEQSDRFCPMTWEMIRRLLDAGHCIASHTCTHRMLSLLSTEQKRIELTRSRTILQDRLDQPVDWLVYPYGYAEAVDAESMALASQCGYRVGLMNMARPPAGPEGLSVGRFALPATTYRPHLHACLSGLKRRLKLG